MGVPKPCYLIGRFLFEGPSPLKEVLTANQHETARHQYKDHLLWLFGHSVVGVHAMNLPNLPHASGGSEISLPSLPLRLPLSSC